MRNNQEAELFQPFFSSSLASYPDKLRTLDVTSRRGHIAGKVNNVPVSDLTIDTATDLPCISQTFIDDDPSLKHVTVHNLRPNSFNLRSAQGSRMAVLGFVRSNLTLGNIDRTVAPLVIPYLGNYRVLLDIAILTSFRAVLDWGEGIAVLEDITGHHSRYASSERQSHDIFGSINQFRRAICARSNCA